MPEISTGEVEASESVDLIVVGFGAAGAAAAITAADLGAKVLVLEKQSARAHTPNVRMSGGSIMAVTDVEAAVRYLDQCAGGLVPRDISRAWAERAERLMVWLSDHAGIVGYEPVGEPEYPDFAGAEAVHVCRPTTGVDGTPVEKSDPHEARLATLGVTANSRRLTTGTRSGLQLWEALYQSTASRPNIEIEWESPAVRLVQADGRVVGVDAKTRDGVQRFTSRCGVVLCPGGFEFDEEAKSNYLPGSTVSFYGNPGNTGDGLRMAAAVGADTWHMNLMVGRAVGHFELSSGSWANFIIMLEPGGYVITDRDGKRFGNEHDQALLRHAFYHYLIGFDVERRCYPRIPCFWFFDRKRLDAGPLTSTVAGLAGVGAYDWSLDNSKEVDRGWIKTASTIEGLAELAGIAAPEEAAKTVSQYNDMCRMERADPLGRPKHSMIPIEGPPFYCVPLYPGGSNTTGGPRRDAHARILDPFGQPILGLFGAGELGQALGRLYPGDGCNISEALCFGQLAAEAALKADRTPRPYL